MLFAVDVGNTSVNFALMDNETVIKADVLPSSSDCSADFYASVFKSLVGSSPIDGTVLASVNKELDEIILSALKKITPNVMKVSSSLNFNFAIPLKCKESIGADILATNEAAVSLFDDCIIVDIGTATTLQIIKEKAFIGAIIAPGLQMSAKALYEGTSLLPEVDFVKPEKVIGTDTIHCIQSGVIYGGASMIEGLIARTLEELGEINTPNVKIIATGKSAGLIGKIMKKPFDIIDDSLVFKGLSMIYNCNKQQYFKV